MAVQYIVLDQLLKGIFQTVQWSCVYYGMVDGGAVETSRSSKVLDVPLVA